MTEEVRLALFLSCFPKIGREVGFRVALFRNADHEIVELLMIRRGPKTSRQPKSLPAYCHRESIVIPRCEKRTPRQHRRHRHHKSTWPGVASQQIPTSQNHEHPGCLHAQQYLARE